MINYNSYNKYIFSKNSEWHDLLHYISCVSITAHGLAVSNMLETSGPIAELVLVSVINGKCSFSFSVDIPIIGLSGVYSTYDDISYFSEGDCKLRIAIDHCIAYPDGEYQLYAPLLLRNISVYPVRRLNIFSEDGIKIVDGYNTSVSYSRGSIKILGSPGQGKGRMRGSSDTDLMSHYRGIKSINGMARGKNVNISMSDKLIEYGAGVSW